MFVELMEQKMKKVSFKTKKSLALGAFALVSLGLGVEQPVQAEPTVGVTTMMSVTSSGEQTRFHVGASSISPDGTYVLLRGDDEIVPGEEDNDIDDLYLKDRVTGELERISVSSDGTHANAEGGRGAISEGGRYVSFSSGATNLVPGDTNGSWDVFVRDRLLGTTERVSISSTGAQAAGGGGASSISRDGRLVAFLSASNDLVPGDTTGYGITDVFVRDRVTKETKRVSVSTTGAQQKDYGAVNAVISGNGRYVAFTTEAPNLDHRDNRTDKDIFLHDLTDSTTTLITVDASGKSWIGDAGANSISHDGRFIGIGRLVSVPGYGIGNQAFLLDRSTSTVEMVSLTSEGLYANGPAGGPEVSDDGRYVAFASLASNLVPEDKNAYYDVYVRDRLTNTLTRQSVSTSGRPGNGDSWWPDMSADGRVLVFDSGAQNLSPYDIDWFQGDVFVRDLDVTSCLAGNQDGLVSGYLYDYAEIGPTAPDVKDASCSYLVPNGL